MKRIYILFNQVRCSLWAAYAVAIAGGAVYLVQAIRFSHSLPSILDEGNYLYKGLLFARGIYYPFQPYGPWTNKMPLAFLIPGWVQDWFGPGLRTGRWYAIVLSMLLLLGLWITVRRFNGRWWAALSVFLVALVPGAISTYTQAWSQVLIAAMLMWILVLTLGAGRPLWQLLVGCALASLMVMTRQNMVLVLPPLLLYIVWQYGWRKGIYGGLAALLVLVIGHALYWPGILSIWQPWLPFKLTFLTGGGRTAVSSWLAVLVPRLAPPANSSFLELAYPLLDPLHYHFVPLAGLLATLVLWPRRQDWLSSSRFRAAVMLVGLLSVLIVAHGWAALGHEYCNFCFNTYMSFFSPIGILLVMIAAPVWQPRMSVLRQGLAVLLALAITTGVAFISYPTLSRLLTLQIPRVTNLRIQPGTTDLWRSLSNKFDLSYGVLQRLVPSVAGLLLGVVITGIAVLIAVRRHKRRPNTPSAGYLALVSVIVLGAVLSPFSLFGNWNISNNCGGDVISTYEQAGVLLEKVIPAGALVYWRGGLSPIPLLYLPQVRIFPPLLNSGYSFSKSTNSDAAYRKGYWTAELADTWFRQADYILVEDTFYKGDFVKKLDAAKYNEVAITEPITACRDNSRIRVFRREK